ncbi:MAG: MCP four helix bundle domain-containing protein, partial [Planctomycetaceae bacterium]|nr:MCP four helix bundle domain-containing protein [Planctomycetaceae bacterium]
MLNKFKIGTKLIAGFFLILLLLGVVAVFGFWGLSQSAKATAKVTVVTDIQLGILKICGLTQDARLVATYGVLYRTEKYRTDRAKIDQEIEEMHKNIEPLFQNKDLKETLNEIKQVLDRMLVSYQGFVEKDEKWYEIERTRKERLTVLVEKAEFIVKKLGDLTTNIV